MKKILLIIGFFLIPCIVSAKEIEVEWQKNYGGSSDDRYTSVIETSDEGFIAVGYSYSTDIEGLDKTYYGPTYFDEAIIVKYDKKGNMKWQKYFGLAGLDTTVESIVETADDGYVIVANTTGKLAGGGGTTHGPSMVVKFNKDGEEEKRYFFSGEKKSTLSYVTMTSDGGYVVCGSTAATSITGITNKGGVDAVIIKFDKNNNVEWQKNYGGNYEDLFNSIMQTSDGNYLAVGYTLSTDIDGINLGGYTPGAISWTNDAYIVKVDKNGNILWQKSWGGNESDFFTSTTESLNGNYVAIGYFFSSSVNGLVNNGKHSHDGIVIEYDKDGKIINQKNYGGNNYDLFFDISPTANGNLLITGYTYSQNIEGITNKGGMDAYILELSEDYNIIWQKSWGGKDGDSFNSGFQTSDGGYLAVGITSSTDIDGITNKGGMDALIVKYFIKYNLNVSSLNNGTATAMQDGNKGIITVDPDDGYIIDEIIVKDTKDNVIEVKKSTDNKYNFDLYDDVTIEVIFKKVYSIKVNDIENGKATAEQYENGKGRVNAVADEGFELDNIVIKDTTGKEVVYEEKDGYYYFDVNDDLVITVTFKELPKEVVKDEEENPKTADAFIYYACAVVCSLFGIWSVEQYRKTVKE